MTPDTLAELERVLFEHSGNKWPLVYIRVTGWHATEDGYIVKYEGMRDFTVGGKPMHRSYSFKLYGQSWECTELREFDNKKKRNKR